MKHLATWLLPLAGVALVFAVFWPGQMSPDSVWQLAMAREGVYLDWHPPIFSALWRPLDRLHPGPAGMLLVEGATLWAGLAIFTSAALGPGLLAGAAGLFVILLPPIFSELGVIWKDVLCAASLLLAAGLLLRADRGRTRAPALVAVAPLWLAMALRYNAPFGALPLCLWAGALIWPKASKWRAAAAGLALCAALAGLAVSTSNLLTRHRMYPVQQVFLHDLAAISLASDENLLPPYLRDRRRLPVTLEQLRALYRPDLADPITFAPGMRTADRDQVGELRRAWLRAVPRNLLPYLRHRLNMARGLFGVGVDPKLPFWIGVTPNDLGVALEPSALRDRVGHELEGLRTTPLFRVWCWLLLLAAALVAARRDRAAIAIGSGGLLVAASSIFLVPAGDLRYSLWPMLAALAVAMLALRRIWPTSSSIGR